MALRISGKNMSIGEALRSHVRSRIEMAVTKFAATPLDGHITFEPEGSGFRAECTLHFKTGTILQVEAEAQEPYASFNRAFDRIEERLRRSKRRVRSKTALHDMQPQEMQPVAPRAAKNGNGHGIAAISQLHDDAVDDEKDEAFCPAVIAEPPAHLREMTVSNAVLQLDGTDMPLVVFRHAMDGRPSIVYRRADGNIGWIDSIIG